MRNLILKIFPKLNHDLQKSSSVKADEILAKFNEAESHLYAKLPPVPAIESKSENTSSHAFTKANDSVEVEHDSNDLELKILQRFSANGLILNEINKKQRHNSTQLEFIIKLNKPNDADNLYKVIQNLKFDFSERTTVQLFRSSKNHAKNKLIRIHIEIMNISRANKGVADVRIQD